MWTSDDRLLAAEADQRDAERAEVWINDQRLEEGCHYQWRWGHGTFCGEQPTARARSSPLRMARAASSPPSARNC